MPNLRLDRDAVFSNFMTNPSTIHRHPVLCMTGLAIVLGFSGLFAFFYWPQILLAGPSGIHYIRQTDSLAFVAYFRTFSTDLFSSGILDLRNAPQQGLCAGEFPLFYWVIGMLERWVGDTPYLLKGLNVLLVLLGHISLTRAMTSILGNALAAMGLGVLFFGSSVLVYYTCNFLPDAGVYGLVLLAWSLVLPGAFRGEVHVSLTAVLLLTLAGLIKAPAAMHLVALSALLIADVRKVWSQGVPTRMRLLMPPAIGLLLILFWHLHVNHFNAAHDSKYFLTWAEPIWTTPSAEREAVVDLITNYWWSKYLHQTTWHVLLVLTVIAVVRLRAIPSKVLGANVLLLGASACFILLFFRKFADHDYYFLTVLPALVLFTITGIWATFGLLRATWWRWVLVAGIWGLAVSSIALAHLELQRRNVRPADRYSRTQGLVNGLAEAARQMELPLEARVIVLGDSTTNGALLAIGRMGWTFPGFPQTADPDITSLKRDGASHLLYLGETKQLSVSAQLITQTPTWSLWSINE